ncbi:uncharacterized protein QC763_0039720 [Podospora pseudopauciseta]|uniref:Uncharacterized protein n=2 Tax=Podospora TaxID=5144 RepID=A0ABR0HQF4_9PEZI|nr:hypothetical protein QC763_0039720 [Podospora pseudopauciseta]KAK4679995.1 hypothetical protein QC764_0040490 [Podospora pseudoanserina]
MPSLLQASHSPVFLSSFESRPKTASQSRVALRRVVPSRRWQNEFQNNARNGWPTKLKGGTQLSPMLASSRQLSHSVLHQRPASQDHAKTVKLRCEETSG